MQPITHNELAKISCVKLTINYIKMEELFNDWLNSKDTSENIIEHLKTQKSFHIDFLKYAKKRLNLGVVTGTFKDRLAQHIKDLENEILNTTKDLDTQKNMPSVWIERINYLNNEIKAIQSALNYL